MGFIAIVSGIKEWWSLRKKNKDNPLGNLAILSLSVSGIMLMGNIPATIGMEFYPIGNITIFSTGIMAFAVIKYGGKNIKTESLRISSYLVPFALFTVLFMLIVINKTIPENVSLINHCLHLLLSGVPLVLISFLATFILIRPIAQKVDYALHDLLLAKEATEKQKEELENIGEYSKKLNSKLDLDRILGEIFSYFQDRYNIEAIIMQFYDKEKNEFYTYKTTSPENATQEMINYSRKLRLPYDERLGILFSAFNKLKTLYLPRVVSSLQPPIIREMIEVLKFKGFLCVPLVIQDEIIGNIFFTTYRDKLNLTKLDISNISIFCNQISTALQNSKLFKQVREAIKEAEIERGIALISREETEVERQKSEKLLLNILPKDVAMELKEKGFAEPSLFESVSVLFTDFKGFTSIAENMSPNELVKELDACFIQFDKITEHFNLEKLKTIGDSYMCAGGIPIKNKTHAIDSILAALEIQNFMNTIRSEKEKNGLPYWEIRLGIHTGPLVAGVIGERKFAYDVWGDTVNTASRMESSGAAGKINISGATYELVKDFFECEYRGKINAKNKGEIDMYFVHGLKPEFSKAGTSLTPNGNFWGLWSNL